MEKKNTVFVIVIVVLALAVGLLGGYIVSEKLTNKDDQANENNQNNNDNKQPGNENNEQNNGDSNVSDSITLTEVESLMEKYLISICSDSYISDLSVTDMNFLAIENVKNRQDFDCEDIYKGKIQSQYENFVEVYTAHMCYGTKRASRDLLNYAYSYNDVLNSKKQLFGNDATLSKESFTWGKLILFDYVSEKNLFVPHEAASGCGGDFVANIDSFEVKNGVLTVIANNSSKINNIKDTYKYVFKRQNTGYYLAEIEEVK